MKKQAGFTLIELIMVIVILGVLSAFAFPRFADFSKQAREASLDGLAGALRASANISHAQQLAEGATLGTAVSLEGQSITMVNGYPTANAAGIAEAAQVDVISGADTEGDYTLSGGGTDGGDSVVFSLQTNCTVTYQSVNATTDNTPPITSSPQVTVVRTGC